MDGLIIKYLKELHDVEKPMWKQYAEALDLTIKHINSYDELDDNLRIPCAYVVKKVLLDNDKFEILDITTLITEFLDYYKEEYKNYMNGFALITDQEHVDICFYDEFIKNYLCSNKIVSSCI